MDTEKFWNDAYNCFYLDLGYAHLQMALTKEKRIIAPVGDIVLRPQRPTQASDFDLFSQYKDRGLSAHLLLP